MSIHGRKYWIQLSPDMLLDPRVGMLSDRLYRRFIECLLLAGRQGDGGRLPPADEAAWQLRLSEAEFITDLEALSIRGLVKTEGSYWRVLYETQPAKTAVMARRYEFAKRRPSAYAHLVDRDGEYCRYCGATHDLTVDHILAIANGGGDDLGNLQLLCRPCNSRKGAR